MTSRNFGLGTRDMKDAASVALYRSANKRECSFSTAATQLDRWKVFVDWAKEEHDLKRMEKIDEDLMFDYAAHLMERVNDGSLAIATAHNYISAVNTVMRLATKGGWGGKGAVEMSMDRRSFAREEAPQALDRQCYEAALEQVHEKFGAKGAALVELCREFGLRSKEASLLNANKALREAKATRSITISKGTKGGQTRVLREITARQVAVLERAATAQEDRRALMPGAHSWATWREADLREIREIVLKHTGGGLHDLRAAYACERYERETGHKAPCAGGHIKDKATDYDVRLKISEELGHHRVDVTIAYLGARR